MREKKIKKKITLNKDYFVNSSQGFFETDSRRQIINSNKFSINVINNRDVNEQKKENRKKEIESYLFNEYISKKESTKFNPFFSLLSQKGAIKNAEKELELELKLKMKAKKEKKKQGASFKHKEFSENEINKIDFDDAISYDKRTFIQIFVSILKQKQSIISTFCSNDPFKPFSIKLLALIFSFSCYFVINGFLYNEEYISNKLKSDDETKTIIDYFNDSIGRIAYTSLIGGLISFVVEMAFNIEKKIENAMDKLKKNKILLRGEISKIYKCNKIIMGFFIILVFILMACFTIYIFCFCYVYPNNSLDWIISSLFVIGLIQIFSFLSSLLISFVRYIAIKRHSELCFTINKYLYENL